MISRFAHRLMVLTLTLLCSGVGIAQEAESKKRPEVTSVIAIAPSIHDAMQSRRYQDAVKLIEAELQKETAKAKDYLLYLSGVALLEDGQLAEADAAFTKLENDFPESAWISRSRFGRASVAVKQRRYDVAGKIYRAEAERLLSRGRKDELAKIYLEFADRFFEGIEADDPSKAKQPDYKQALEYYREAHKLGPSVESRQRIEFRIARCMEELDQFAEAIAAYETFLTDHDGEKPASGTAASLELRSEAHYRLGLTLLAHQKPAAARRAWQDLLTDYQAASADDPDLAKRLASAEYKLAHTYGLPKPRTIGDLELGVRLAEQFVEKHPDHELAARAELEIAQSYEHHGRNVQVVDRLEQMIANENYAESEQLPVVRRMLGEAYLAQLEFQKAIEAWRTFLTEHPTDPNWPDVQTKIISAEYRAADHARSEKQYEQARTLWQTFLNKYPLDKRAPGILFQFGEMKFLAAAEHHSGRVDEGVKQGKKRSEVAIDDTSKQGFEAAIADWQRLLEKYPQSDEASQAALKIGVTYEDRLGLREEALEAYKKVTGSAAPAAKQRIARLTKTQLEIRTERKFRSDETPNIVLTTRNLENVSIAVYSIDMVDYFRKMHLATGVEELDIALIDPDQQIEHSVANYEPYKRIEEQVSVPIEGPGVSAVTVSSDTMEATTMLVVSDLDMIVKASRNELFVFAQNMLTGKPADGVSILVSDGDKVVEEHTTDKEGIVASDNRVLRSVEDLRVFAVTEGHIASTVTNLNGLDFAVGLAPTGHLATDRPVYRPGELVHLKGIVRWVDGDQFTFREGERFSLDVYDPRGRKLKSEKVELDGFGTVQSNWTMPKETPPGNCRVHLHRPSSPGNAALSFESRFQVRHYRLEPIELTVDTDKDVYFRGDEIKADVTLAYYYGAPLAGETITYSLGGQAETQTATTDDDGKVTLTLPTQRFSETQAIPLQVSCAARNVSQSKNVFLATRGFRVQLATPRRVYLTGETFDVTATVNDPGGKAVATELKIELFEVTRSGSRTGERLVDTFQKTTGEESGEANQTLQVESGGTYRIRATGKDQFGNDVSGQVAVQISGDDDSTRLRILAETHHYQVGDVAKVRLHWREDPALALVTFDGASVLGHRLVQLKTGENVVEVPLDAGLAPNFFLSACVMQRNQFHEAVSGFFVSKRLNIKLTPSKTELTPTESLKLGVEVTDASGNPVATHFALAMLQQSLLQRFSNAQFSIENRFASQLRQRRMRQSSSCTFSYSTETREIDEALIAEASRVSNRFAEIEALELLREGRDRFGRDTSWMARNSVEFSDDMAMTGGAMGGIGGGGTWERIDSDGSLPAYPQNLSLSVAGQAQYGGQQIDALYGQMNAPPTQLFQSGRAMPQSAAQLSQSRGWSELNYRRSAGVYYEQLGRQAGQSRGVGREFFFDKRVRHDLNDWDSASFKSALQQRDTSINALTLNGQLLVINGMDAGDFERFTSAEGARVLSTVASGETGYWNPIVITDDDGKAELEITMPAESTSWTLHAAGVTKETLAGNETIDLVTRKKLFGKLKTPQAFTVGDSARIEVEVHHGLEGKHEVQIVLKATMGNKTTEQRESVAVESSGVRSISFPIEIDPCEEIDFTLAVEADDQGKDIHVSTVPVLPYGFPVYQTASGTASQNTLVQLELPQKQKSRSPSMELLIGSGANQSLIDAMVRGDTLIPRRCVATGILSRSASDCLGGVAVLKMIRRSSAQDSPQATTVSEIVAGAVSNLIAAQRDDGGWSQQSKGGNPDPLLSARIMWALSRARAAGFAIPQEQFAKGLALLQSAFTQEPDLNRQSVLLAAQSACGRGDFALANRLYRERNRLDSHGLVYLMYALTELNHDEMAAELVHLVKPNEPRGPFSTGRTDVEIAAVELLALQAMETQPERRRALASKLEAARAGSRWPVESDNGPALAALAAHHGATPPRREAVDLMILVNGKQLETITIKPGAATRRLKVPPEMIVDGEQTVEFELGGRGEFSYSAVLTGFADADSIASTTNDWTVRRRYEPDQLRLDGRLIPRGHGVINGSYSWKPNVLGQLPVGVRGKVTLSPRVRYRSSKPIRAYLMLIEPIPAGCTVLEESIEGNFQRYEITPGAITFYLGDSRPPGDIRYSIAGYLPGKYRVAPAVLRNYHSPAEIAVTQPASLEVLPRGGKSHDEYRLTPDELFALGKAYYQKGDFQKTFDHLSQLQDGWNLDPEPFKESSTLLFRSAMKLDSHAETVKYFEILKERFPGVELSFEEILNVAAAYREIAEYERSYLVYRATIQGSFERENQVAGFLNGRGEFLRSVETMESLLRDYPAESYVATASYALAQEVYRRAGAVADDKRLADAGVTRVDLIDGSVRMLDDFVTNWPSDPSADQASFALATALIDLNQYQSAIDRGEQYAERYPESRLLDSFWYMIGFCYFELKDHQKALEMCRKVAEAEFADADSGSTRQADNKWEAVYIMGQIHHSLGQAARAIDEYTKVSERFKDAAEAIEFFTRKSIAVPDVTTVLPGDRVALALEHRNLEDAFVKVYRIDLMKFGLTQRNLDRVTAINLAGIKPYHEVTVELGDGKDYRDRETEIQLPLKEQGAYLVVCRGENLYASGLVVISPLELAIQEDAVSGRVRVSVKDKREDEFVGDVHVKVIGSANEEFISGQTDLRGLFIADDVQGTSTVIVVGENDQYAFYRGKQRLQDSASVRSRESQLGEPFGNDADPFGAPAEAAQQEAAPQSKPLGRKQQLLENVFNQNGIFQREQKMNFDGLMNNRREGIQTKEAY